MRRNRLLLPWGLLAGLLIWIAVVEGLNIKPPSLLKKPRNYTTTTTTTKPSTTTTPTTNATTESESDSSDTTEEGEHESDKDSDGNVTTKSPLSGIPQIDYVFDPNLPRELPRGYNLSEYPFFSTVPNDIVFECDGLLDGFYASIFYKCQIYHHCVQGTRYDFLCANYTAFDQRTFICQFVSEVDCVNSAKWWFRNEPLYKGRITTTTTTTTIAPPPTAPTTRRPAASGPGRRRRPLRRRRPQFDYYYDDDEYDEDEYDDDLNGPGQTGSRQRKRQRRPNAGALASSDAGSDVDDKPSRPPPGGGSVYDRPRVLPKIRRPVPITERDKYEYSPKGGGTDNGGGEKRTTENRERPSNEEPERPKRPVEPSVAEVEKPREPEVSSRLRPNKRPTPAPAPAHDDDEYYDDEDDYEQPIRTSSRKNNQDYYAPSGADRDFARRPAMSGAGRPLRRNRPGRRKPAPVDYDDDYDDRRPLRPSAPAQEDRRRPDDDRRRPAAVSRKRPTQRDEYEREETYERPVPSRERDRDAKRPQSTRETTYERPATSSRESTYERAPSSKTDAAFERTSPKETAFERLSGNKKRQQTSTREPTYERTRQERPGTRTNTDYDRPAAVPETSSGYTSTRPLASRSRFAEVDADVPIPAAKPAYISTTGRSTYRKRGPDEPVTTGNYRGGARTTPRVTEAPALLDDEEYYDDDEEPEDELPQQPTGSGRTGSGTYRDTTADLAPVKPLRKTTASRGSAEVDDAVDDVRVGQNTEGRVKPSPSFQEERGKVGRLPEDRGRTGQVPSTGRERVVPVAEEGRGRRPSYSEAGAADVNTEGRGRPVKNQPPAGREQTRSNTNYRVAEEILEQPLPLRTTQANYRTKDEDFDVEVPLPRQGFRPKVAAEATTEASQRYNNFRRKSNQASNIESTKVLPSRDDRVVEVAEDVHIAPSSQNRGYPSDAGEQTDVELESDDSQEHGPEDSSSQLDTSKLLSSSETEADKPVGPSGSGRGFGNNRNAQTSATLTNQRNSDEVPRKIELPDIDDPEYDVTLNEALHPTRPILLSTEGAQGSRGKIPNYQYRDVSIEPDLAGEDNDKSTPTLLTSASQTHVSKAPFPAYGKDTYRDRGTRTQGRGTTPRVTTTFRSAPQYEEHTVSGDEDYDDPPIPTGRGGSTGIYSTTESSFRPSQQPSPISGGSRGTSGQQFPVPKSNTQYDQYPVSPVTGTLRQLEQELAKTLPRTRVNHQQQQQQQYRSPSQGTIREADFYRGAANPITISLGYDADYDQVPKYRPRRKYVWRDRSRDYYSVY